MHLLRSKFSIWRKGYMEIGKQYLKIKKLKAYTRKCYEVCCKAVDIIESDDFELSEDAIRQLSHALPVYKEFRDQINELNLFIEQCENDYKKVKLEKFTKEQIKQMQELAILKLSKAEICRKFNISYPTLQKYLAINVIE